jgi:hypothetical protein
LIIHSAWLILFILLLLTTIRVLVAFALSLLFLSRRIRPSISASLSEPINGQVSLYLVVPLLREQKVIKELFRRFTLAIEMFPEATLVLVTTQREIVEASDYPARSTTIEMIEDLITNYRGPKEQVQHIHYPEFNQVVAEQLNYAFQQLAALPGPPLSQRYVAVYNADSIIDLRTVQLLLASTELRAAVTQQSSLFLWNVPELLSARKYHVAGYGLYQSCWTLVHEIPRFLCSRRYLRWLPTWIERNSLVHCVGHGVLLRLDVVRAVNGIPVSQIGGEDLALGFVLKMHGYNVEPITMLENAETPHTYITVLKQLAGWFLGTVGYLVYWKNVPASVRRSRRITLSLLTALGVWDAIKWLFKGPILVTTIILGYLSGHFVLTVMLFLAYVYFPIVILVMFWRRLNTELFPQPSVAIIPALLVYPLVPIMRSIPAFLGAWWACRIVLGKPFLKPKTER